MNRDLLVKLNNRHELIGLLVIGCLVFSFYTAWLIQTRPPVLTDKQIVKQAAIINFEQAQRDIASVPKILQEK